jgi:hypothetical protein
VIATNMECTTIQKGSKAYIKSSLTDYILAIDISNREFGLHEVKSPLEVHFEIPSRRLDFELITGRDMDDYIDIASYHSNSGKSKLLPLDSSLQYVEIGAGLGEFTPYLIKQLGTSLRHKPIVIDPADYAIMKDMLHYAISQHFGERYDERCLEFSERCDIISDPEKVKLFSMTLGQAVKGFPELMQIGDVVIDLCGAKLYSYRESPDGSRLMHSQIEIWEKELTKSYGRLITSS